MDVGNGKLKDEVIVNDAVVTNCKTLQIAKVYSFKLTHDTIMWKQLGRG